MYFAQGDSVLRSTNVDASTPTWSVMGNATTGGSVSALGISKQLQTDYLLVVQMEKY